MRPCRTKILRNSVRLVSLDESLATLEVDAFGICSLQEKAGN
jgi:hypothetical protein